MEHNLSLLCLAITLRNTTPSKQCKYVEKQIMCVNKKKNTTNNDKYTIKVLNSVSAYVNKVISPSNIMNINRTKRRIFKTRNVSIGHE